MYSSLLSSVIVFPLMAEMVRRSACPRIEIRGREDNLVADPPTRGVQDFYRVAACCGRICQLGPGVGPVTVQVQGSAHEHDPAVNFVSRSTHSTYIFVFDVVREGDCRLARVGGLFSTNLQLPVQHDPLGGQFKILIVLRSSVCR
jgi:hypothetical protein